MRIFFYYCCYEYQNKEIFIGTAHLYLKTYVDINYPELSQKLVWLEPEQHKLTDENLLEKIKKLKPDIICTSHYIWNHSYLKEQLKNIKPLIDPNIQLVVGGPNIDCHLDKDFFQKYNYVNFAIYGPGEKAFADVLHHLVFKSKLNIIDNTNLAWKNSLGQQVVAPYKFQNELSLSPYTHNKKLLESTVKKETMKGYKVALAYSNTRGCPYSCTFCDWNSGLSNKVSRRKSSFKEDIDLFYEIGIKEFFLADANVGQYDEDIEMIEYFAKMNIVHQANFHIRGNFSKLKKQNNLKIYKSLARSKLILTSFNFSVQDTNEVILKNINRPDVGWSVHKQMINQLLDEFPYMHATIQLIQGLPGQTVKSWKTTLNTISEEKTLPMIFINETLPASPAMLDKEYQTKWKFEYVSSKRFDGFNFYQGQFAGCCVSFNKHEFVTMTLMSILCTAISIINLMLLKNNIEKLQFQKILERFCVSELAKKLHENLLENWIKNNSYYFTRDFDQNNAVVSACSFMSSAMTWINNKNFIRFVLNQNSAKTNAKIVNTIKKEIHNNYITNILLEHS